MRLCMAMQSWALGELWCNDRRAKDGPVGGDRPCEVGWMLGAGPVVVPDRVLAGFDEPVPQ